MFGLPGGPELLIIGGIIVLLFVPSAAFFAVGYFVGKRSGALGGADPAPASEPAAVGDTTAPDTARTERSDGDV